MLLMIGLILVVSISYYFGFQQGKSACRESLAPTVHKANELSTARLLEIADRTHDSLPINGYEAAIMAMELLELRDQKDVFLTNREKIG